MWHVHVYENDNIPIELVKTSRNALINARGTMVNVFAFFEIIIFTLLLCVT